MANDITALLYRIKENICAIEAGDTRDPLLSEVRSDFLELVENWTKFFKSHWFTHLFGVVIIHIFLPTFSFLFYVSYLLLFI